MSVTRGDLKPELAHDPLADEVERLGRDVDRLSDELRNVWKLVYALALAVTIIGLTVGLAPHLG